MQCPLVFGGEFRRGVRGEGEVGIDYIIIIILYEACSSQSTNSESEKRPGHNDRPLRHFGNKLDAAGVGLVAVAARSRKCRGGGLGKLV